MKIEITGSRCISCQYYTQYYENHHSEGFRAINAGFCGARQRGIKPGERCWKYLEKGNLEVVKEDGR